MNRDEWEINLHFDFVTHLPSKVSFMMEHRHAPASKSDCTPLYVGEVLPSARLDDLRGQAIDLWNRVKFGRAA